MFFRKSSKKPYHRKSKINKCIVINLRQVTHNLSLVFMFVCVFYFSANFIDTRTAQVASMQNEKAYLAIVIDDFGYGGEGTEEMIALDVPLTCAVMPFSEGTQDIILRLENSNKEAILHMPMESLHGKKSWVGDKGIFLDMTDEEVKRVVEEAFGNTENVVGLNNHMGSAIMEDERCLEIVIEALKGRDLFLLDSVTTPNSKADELCAKYGVCFLKRDVFLDGTDDITVVKDNLMKAANAALENGSAIAIGHVGPEGGLVTVNAIKELQAEIEGMGIQFVTLSELKEIKYGSNTLYN